MRLLIIVLAMSMLVGCDQQEQIVDTTPDTEAVGVEDPVDNVSDNNVTPDTDTDTLEEQQLCEECGAAGATGEWQGKTVCNRCWNRLHDEYVTEQLKHIGPLEVDKNQENVCAICGEGSYNYIDQTGLYFCDIHIGDYNDVDELQ